MILAQNTAARDLFLAGEASAFEPPIEWRSDIFTIRQSYHWLG